MDFSDLVHCISEVNTELTKQAVKAVNRSLTLRNWLIGYYIREFEQHGSDRALYGESLLDLIAARLSDTSGFSARTLRLYRQFYLVYPNIWQTLSAESAGPEKWQSLFATFNPSHLLQPCGEEIPIQSMNAGRDDILMNLSFSHFTLLMPLDDPLKRRFYEVECVRGNWSVRELKRQIESLYFERSALSQDKQALSEHVQAGAQTDSPHLIIRDPCVFDFLGIKSEEVMYESDLEQVLLRKLESFLLELGYGFCFEARQKRILIGDEYFFVDLVFYHRVLKCHVIIELKTGGFSHEALGQLNTYLNYFKAHLMTEGDNPPVGLLLCTTQNHALVQYACAGIDNQVFVSKYQVRLPGTEESREFVERVIRDE
ncbi:protein of unknown function DUF1016 [Methanospirillum hungatei JF-1]|uniref:Cytoplasmic protein n=1 Tax=Methanospirillum hungatei JF-1 (strain ATCC 27890 / DSM 864 / NBRC 100397 / JF-1) TaxID=323259 RepID=Q2FSJ8_METHJ|nr:PDDEXK nuclease domain-containing protein [Methanospirillum hungatei]ABD42481.1 protein of unknown function DUF1016 [Methanospirillum hungatei JF-1]